MKFKTRAKRVLLSILGDTKILPYPPFLYYQRGTYYKVTGADTTRMVAMLRPGDIVMRGYRNYLDDYLIPGEYSHSGIYIGGGKVVHAVTEGVSEQDVYDFFRCDRCAILRANGDGISTSEYKKLRVDAVDYVKSKIGTPYDVNFEDNDMLYCHELCAKAYRCLGISKRMPVGLASLLGVKPKYLDSSFLLNSCFSVVHRI